MASFSVSESSDDDDVPCSQAGNIQISRKFSVSDYSDLLAEASPTTRPRAQQSASARSDLEYIFWLTFLAVFPKPLGTTY